jgi:hypothetical protein
VILFPFIRQARCAVNSSFLFESTIEILHDGNRQDRAIINEYEKESCARQDLKSGLVVLRTVFCYVVLM